jgi:hypothetical protein
VNPYEGRREGNVTGRPSIGGARDPTACGGAWSPAPRGLVMTRLFEAGSAKGFGVFFH